MRWLSTPFYGVFLAPVWLLARGLGLLVLAGVGLGAAGALLIRRFTKKER